MPKITILAGMSNAKELEKFTVQRPVEIVDLYVAPWDASANSIKTASNAEVRIRELQGTKIVAEVLASTKALLIANLKEPLKIQHHPDVGNTIVLESNGVDYVAYVLRIASPD